MTAGALLANLTIPNTTTLHDGPSQPQAESRQSWPCRTCNIWFSNGYLQREHMKTPWHIYNLKRRIASLPPLTSEVFDQQILPTVESEKPIRQRTRQQDKDDKHTLSPFECLFCPTNFQNSNEDMGMLMSHMFSVHGMFIPRLNLLIDAPSFLKYLGTQVRVWHECLHCGITRTSTLAIQDHMNDRGHCKLNFEKEPELLDFWEQSIGPQTKNIMRLDSVVARELKQAQKRALTSTACRQTHFLISQPRGTQGNIAVEANSLRSGKPFTGTQCPRQSRRTGQEVGNTNLLQRHALVAAVKRSRKEETRALEANALAYGCKGNDRKHDQAYGSLSWAKGGLHNLLPR